MTNEGLLVDPRFAFEWIVRSKHTNEIIAGFPNEVEAHEYAAANDGYVNDVRTDKERFGPN